MTVSFSRCLLLVCAILPGSAAATEPCLTTADLKRLNPCELEQLFAQGSASAVPAGATRGKILHFEGAHLPNVKARLAETVWKGKVFEADGTFTNQWLGIRAVDSQAVLGDSWHDGKPAIIMEYPRGSPVFANTHDEIREVAPGLYLGRFYDRCPCPKFRGYFALELKCGK